MNNLIVISPTLAVNVSGLRFVEKTDRTSYASSSAVFSIHLAWKGQEQTHSFPSRGERDAVYEAIVKRMDPSLAVPHD